MSEVFALAVVLPFGVALAASRRTPLWGRIGGAMLGLGTLLVDGALLAAWYKS